MENLIHFWQCMYRWTVSSDELICLTDKNLATSFTFSIFILTSHLWYVKWGSDVFCCFADFSNAFDYVDYWLLICKLFDSSNDLKFLLLTQLLATWYSSQTVFVWSIKQKLWYFYTLTRSMSRWSTVTIFILFYDMIWLF